MTLLGFKPGTGTEIRPARSDTVGRNSWAKNPTLPGGQDGSIIDQTFLNDLRGLVTGVFDAYGYSAIAGDDAALAAAILAKINGSNGQPFAYKGSWNALSNLPALASGAGTRGDTYLVATAGSTTLDGISAWSIGDIVAFSGSVWQKIPSPLQQRPGLTPKAACVAATTANITLSGLQAIDGVSVTAAQRVLVMNQTAPAENGIWVAASGAWVRAFDMDDWSEVPNALVPVTGGIANANTTWVSSSASSGVIGTTAVTFIQLPIFMFSNYTAVWAGPFSQKLIPNDSSSSARAYNLAAAQSVIDFAFANGLQTTWASAGNFYMNPGLYVDPPGNLRSNPAVPTNFAFSLALIGAGGLGNNNNQGTQFLYTDNTQACIILGTGQGMRASSLSVRSVASYTSRAALPAGGIGIALSGGAGGSSRSQVDGIWVEHFRHGFKTGWNVDQLCDSNLFFKCHAAHCYAAYTIGQTQNWINTLIDCNASNCKKNISTQSSKPVTVIGGNLSATEAYSATLTVGSTSGLSVPFVDLYEGQNFDNWSFTTVLSAANQFMTDGAFDGFCMKLTGYGVVPLSLVSYNPGTRVATFKFYPGWLLSQTAGSFAYQDLKNSTDIATEIQAQASLYCCERVIIFDGPGFTAIGTHIENPGCVTTLATMAATFGGAKKTKLTKLMFNYQIDQTNYFGGNNAVFYNQQVWPFLHSTGNNTIWAEMLELDGASNNNGVNVEMFPYAPPLRSDGCDWKMVNITIPGAGTEVPGFYGSWSSMSRGGGNFDSTPNVPTGNGSMAFYQANGEMEVPFEGWSPHRAMTPRLRQAWLPFIGATGAALGAIGAYPAINGETIYSVLDFDNPYQPKILMRSAHWGFSYGQDFTDAWSYKAKSNVVTVADTGKFFAGLTCGFDNGGGVQYYMCTGVYPQLGYITVAGSLAGTMGSTYTGSTVKQQPFSWTRYPQTFGASAPASILANFNDFKPDTVGSKKDSPMQRWTIGSGVPQNLTGMTWQAGPQQDGDSYFVWNTGGFNIVFKHEDVGSIAANRFRTSAAGDLTLGPGKCAIVMYDGSSSRWLAALTT